MAFEPNKITKEHVLLAIKHIQKDELELIPSRRYDAHTGAIEHLSPIWTE